MNESSLIVMFFSLSTSSIFVWSTFFGPDVVDDLDPLPLFHAVHDDLAQDAVRVPHVVHLDDEVVEEVRPPQPLEVGDRDLLRARRRRAPTR